MNTPTLPDILSALQAGEPAVAERLGRQILERQPHDADVQLLLALSLQQQGRGPEALELYAGLARQFPDSGLHWGNYATALREAGALDEADAAYATSLRLDPDNAEQWLNLGLLRLQQRAYPEAREALLNAHDLDPQSPAIRIHAARACSLLRDEHRLDELVKPWREWLPLEPELQFELAVLLFGLGDATTAQVMLEDALQRAPAYMQAKLLLASVYERVNRLDAAAALLRDIAADPLAVADPTVQSEIAHQQATLAFRNGELAQARATLEHAGPRNEADYAHFFALAGICDKLHDRSAALRALTVAHARQVEEMRLVVPHRFAEDAPVLPNAVGRVSRADYLRWPPMVAPDPQQSPVFIVGFPRSGTTLLEQMLDAHPRLQSMDERPFFNILSDQLGHYGFRHPYDLDKLSQSDCDELRKGYLSMACSKVPRRWDAQLVDKNPMNMLWLPMIHRLFPQAKFILALRHPCDVLLSNYMQNFRSTVLALACASIERLATAYVAAMECWLDHVAVLQPQVFVSRYEDLVADTAGQTQRIAAFLGLEDAAPLLTFDQRAREKGYIATPSYTQVIVPVNRKGLGRWVGYRDALAPALPILEPMLKHWGYAVD